MASCHHRVSLVHAETRRKSLTLMLPVYVVPLRAERASSALRVLGSAALTKSPYMAVMPHVQPGDCLNQDLPLGRAGPMGPPLT